MIKTFTLALIAINVVVFLVGQLTHQYDRMLSFTPAYAFDMPWTFVTSMFMHANITHLFFNMFTLFIFGMVLESRMRWWEFFLFYLAAGIVGNFAMMGMAYSGLFPSPIESLPAELIPGVGASGAIMGVLGALALVTPHLRMYAMLIPVPVPMWVGVIIFAVFNIAISFAPTLIGTGAHLGGLAAGVLFGILLRHQINRQESRVRIRYVWE